jgi:hypothetical protein
MALEIDKTNDNCSNLYLIDERLCLKNSYEILNTNTKTVSANLYNLQSYVDTFKIIYTNFSNNSARWITAISNFQTLSSEWFSAETTFKNLSSYWYTDLHIIYNKIVDLDTFNQTTCETNIKNWLILYFNSNFVNGQIIRVDLYLSREEPFTWSYNKSYYESCIPQQQTPPTPGCRCEMPNEPCNFVAVNDVNIFGTKHNGANCINAVTRCNESTPVITGTGALPRCTGYGATNVDLTYTNPQKDKSLTRVITLKYKKENNTIIKI